MRTFTLPTFAEIQIQDQQNPWTVSYMRMRMDDIQQRGFARLSVEMVDQLAIVCRGKRVIEVGAGLGVLSASLHDRDIDITAYDINTGLYADFGWFEPYFPIREVDAAALGQFDADVIIMAWPCLNTSFAHDVAKSLRKGQRLIYLGESQGGCTASDDFFQQLGTCRWRQDEAASDVLNQFYQAYSGWNDWWQVFDRVL